MSAPTSFQANGIVVDSFAGLGGASFGIKLALGREPDIAINHDPEAIALHTQNHPTTKHYCESVWKVDPVTACAGRDVDLMWASPDCKHFSKAKGAKPVENRVRGLAWVVIRWAKTVAPRVIILENVEEFADWGPLQEDGLPDPKRKGHSFRRWLGHLKGLGYAVEFRELRACDYGAPTSRKRLFVIARRDGLPIVWPQPTHASPNAERDLFSPQLPPWRTAAECIDWSLPCPSIFERERPLADNTLARIAHGIQRYVINEAKPFVMPVTHHGPPRIHSLDEPMRTVTGAHRGEYVLVAPTLVQTGYGEREGQSPRSLNLHAPLGTAVAGGVKHALVAAFLARHYGGVVGQSLRSPMSTVTTVDHHALVTAFLIKFYGNEVDGQRVTDPLGTVTTRDRFGLVVVDGVDYQITDIGMRMLSPRELARAQGFPDSFALDMTFEGKPLSKSAQTRMIGNSVCPPIAEALVRANVRSSLTRSLAA